jgi:hypothetical protein
VANNADFHKAAVLAEELNPVNSIIGEQIEPKILFFPARFPTLADPATVIAKCGNTPLCEPSAELLQAVVLELRLVAVSVRWARPSQDDHNREWTASRRQIERPVQLTVHCGEPDWLVRNRRRFGLARRLAALTQLS